MEAGADIFGIITKVLWSQLEPKPIIMIMRF